MLLPFALRFIMLYQLLCVLDHLHQFFLVPVPFDLGSFPVVHLHSALLQLFLAPQDFLIQFLFSLILLFDFLLQVFVQFLQSPTLFHNLIEPFPNILHLLFHCLSLLSFAFCVLQLSSHGINLFVLLDPQGLDEIQKEIGSICGVFLFVLEDIFIIVDGELNFVLQGFDLVVEALGVLMGFVGVDHLIIGRLNKFQYIISRAQQLHYGYAFINIQIQTHLILIMSDTNQPPPPTHTQSNSSYFSDFKNLLLASGLTNVAIKTILSPLERWKIISQTQYCYPLRPKKFTNFLDFLKRIPNEQGIVSFWRGNMIYSMMHFYQLFFQIFIFDSLRQDVEQYKTNYRDNFETPIIEHLGLPLLASFISMILLHPLDSYRVRTSMSYHKTAKEAQFTKFRQFMGIIKRQENFRAVYRGFLIANIISFLNFQLYYNVAKAMGNGGPDSLLSPELLASFMGVLVLHPLDTVKKIMQLNNMSKPVLFTGYRSLYRYFEENKLKNTLYNGIGVSFVKLGLSVGLFWAYEQHRSGKQIE